jgi:cell division protein FtsW
MRRYDLSLLLVILVLVLFGLMSVGSASWFVATEEYKDPYHFLTRQGFSVVVGLAMMAGLALVPYQKLLERAALLYGASMAGLIMVWIPGLSHRANGATRWFGVGGFTFQPAELAKVAALVCLSAWIQRNKGNVSDIRVLILAGVGLFPILCLLLIQPDFGSTMILCLLCGVMLFLSGIRWSWVFALGGLGGSGLMAIMLAESYRVARLTGFTDPCSDPAAGGYQVCQSLVALHNGGLWGQGLGNGQGKLLYLPEPYNDFIVAVVGEELGLWGMALLMSLYAFLAWRGLQIARKVTDPYAAILAGTITAMIVGQACLNLGVAMSILPPKGLVLPFLSYGNSAMMMNLAAVGILLSISTTVPQETEKTADKPDVQGSAA